jgi:hypothetical protein
MIINLYIYEQERGYMAESAELCINSNIPELAATPIEFWGSDIGCVVDQVKAYARAKGLSGRIHLIK